MCELADTNGAPSEALAFAAVMDQDHNGRIRGPMNQALRALVKGVKVPAVMIGVQVRNDGEAETRLQHAIGQINSQYGTCLSTSPFEPENGLRITTIQDGRKNFYGSFEPGERIAYTVAGNWMILSSNTSSLKKLMTQRTGGKKAWELGSSSSATASAWVNLDGLGKTLKTAAGAAKLATMLDASTEISATREALDQAGLIAAILRELKQAQLTADSSRPGFRMNLVVGALSVAPKTIKEPPNPDSL